MKNAALITGSAKRIGKEIGLFLAEKNYDIAIHYNNSEKEAEGVLDQLNKIGIQSNCYKADLNNQKSVLKLFENVTHDFPSLSLLINSASIFEESSFVETSEELLNRTLNINFKAPFLLSREFAKTCHEGQVINILDTRISKNPTDHFIYTISKKALGDFTKMAAIELAPGIRVNGIAPGLILPPPGKGDDYLENRSKEIPMERIGKIEDILNAVGFLINNEFITGQFIYVDGGENI